MSRMRDVKINGTGSSLLDQVEQALDCSFPLSGQVLQAMRYQPAWAFRWHPGCFERLAWETLERMVGDDDDPDWDLRFTTTEENP